jgi:hypothetical protein
MTRWIHALAMRLVARCDVQRPPDFVVGADSPGGAYLLRWWLIPRNRLLNAYLHHFLRDDDDRALHDHPWAWCSILLEGAYIEHTIDRGGIHRRQLRTAPSIKFSLPSRPHRVELLPVVSEYGEEAWRQPCMTLFLTGPVVRMWGFHCARRGWVPYREFTKAENTGEIGAGCGE